MKTTKIVHEVNSCLLSVEISETPYRKSGLLENSDAVRWNFSSWINFVWLRFIILLIFAAPLAHAQDYLSPEESQFTGIFMSQYYAMVLDVLKEAYKGDVLARVIVLPSFSPEYALGITKSENKYTIFSVWPEKQLWSYQSMDMMKDGSVLLVKNGKIKNNEKLKEMEKEYPASYKKMPLKRCASEVDSETATRIIAVWESMILATRYQKSDVLGADGTTYHYSMKVGYEEFAGKVWSPTPESKTGKLVSLTDAMTTFCDKKSEESQGKLMEALHEAESAL